MRFVTSFWLRRSCMALGAQFPRLPHLPARIIPPRPTGGKDKNNGSRPISRVLCTPGGRTRRGRQPFLWACGYPQALATYPQARSSRPAVACYTTGGLLHHALAYLVLLRMEVAAFHPRLAPRLV